MTTRTATSAAQPIESDFGPVLDDSPPRTSVGAVVSSQLLDSPAPGGAQSDLVAGLIVHRLLQRFGMNLDLDDADLEIVAEDLIRAAGIADASSSGIGRDAISRFHALRRHAQLRTDYETGDVLHEVPFSLSADGQIIRGAIDCLIRRPDGSIRLLEFKTGRRREHHVLQAEIYRRAAAAIFPGSIIDVDILYARDVTES